MMRDNLVVTLALAGFDKGLAEEAHTYSVALAADEAKMNISIDGHESKYSKHVMRRARLS